MTFKFLCRSAASGNHRRKRPNYSRARFVMNSQKPFEERMTLKAMYANPISDRRSTSTFDVRTMRRDSALQRRGTSAGALGYLKQVKRLARTESEAKRLHSNFVKNFPMLPPPTPPR
jgi:hypothetical protein